MTTPHASPAKPPAVPQLTAEQRREAARRQARQVAGEHVERRRQLRGLVLLALVALALSLTRAGAGRVFPSGWWRLW